VNREELTNLLQDVQEGKVSVEQATKTLKHLPYADIGSAKIDHHRDLRRGFSEVIFCQGKTPQQALASFQELAEHSSRVLATRISPDAAALIRSQFPEACYRQDAKILYLNPRAAKPCWGRVAVLTAGTSDLPVAEEAALTAELLGNEIIRIYDVGVAGLHRLFPHLEELDRCQVLVVIAGMEGALPGVVAGLTDKPVIAVPTSTGYGAGFGGLAALLTMLNSCAPGIGVVNIDNGFGAAVLAHLITKSGSHSDSNQQEQP
jgi:NCAIR mutase (PurE)-related protein